MAVTYRPITLSTSDKEFNDVIFEYNVFDGVYGISRNCYTNDDRYRVWLFW